MPASLTVLATSSTGGLHPHLSRVLEEVGVEQHAEHGADVAARLEVGVLERFDRVGVLRRDGVPRGHLRLVGDEEVVQVPGNESGRRRLPDYDVDDILAVEPARLAQESLDAVVVVVVVVDERRGVVTVRVQRYGLREGSSR